MVSCAYREQLDIGDDLFHCSHPRMHVPGNLVSSEICTHCHFRSRNLANQWPPYERQIEESPALHKWAIGVTTAPRNAATLKPMLESLFAAGWNDIRIFAEPGAKVPEAFTHLPTTRRDCVMGAFPNWYLAIAELYMREPRADVYFILQDDAILADGLRTYLEISLWPAPSLGVVSLYCPSHYSKGMDRGFIIEDRGSATWGALAYLFPNDAVRLLLSDLGVVNHRHHGVATGLRNIDNLVGDWCRRQRRPYYVHEPSLVQHIGNTSTIWSQSGKSSAKGKRAAADYIPVIPPDALLRWREKPKPEIQNP